MTARLQVIEEEGLSENAAKMGEIFSRELKDLRPDIVLKMRGVGLFWAMVIDRKGGKQFKTRYLKVTIFVGIYIRYFCGLAQNCKILYPQTFTYMCYGSMEHQILSTLCHFRVNIAKLSTHKTLFEPTCK